MDPCRLKFQALVSYCSRKLDRKNQQFLFTLITIEHYHNYLDYCDDYHDYHDDYHNADHDCYHEDLTLNRFHLFHLFHL